VDFKLKFVTDTILNKTRFLLTCRKNDFPWPFDWLTLNEKETEYYLQNRSAFDNKVGEYWFDWDRKTEVYSMQGFQQGEYWDFSNIIETRRGGWRFSGKFRVDKPCNAEWIAQRVKRSIDDRIDSNALLEALEKGKMPVPSKRTSSSTTTSTTKSKEYFTSQGQKHRDEAVTRPMLDFHNFVKSTLYDTIFSIAGQNQSLFEMSGGRGGDLWKARKHRPREILIADLDGKALETAKDRWSKRRNPRRDDPVLRTKLADLCEAHKFATLESTPFDLCSCMFAFHYFLKSAETWSAILRTLKDAVKVGGYFFATFFDASKIEKLVGDVPWICRGGSSGEPVLSLSRDRSKETKDCVFGKKLIVFAETIGQHPEFLLDRDWLIKEMKTHGFELCKHEISSGHFSDMYVLIFSCLVYSLSLSLSLSHTHTHIHTYTT